MLVFARGRVGQGVHVAFAQADACALPISTGRFDAVFLATVLGEVPDRDACIAEIGRVLRPGGTVTIAETRRDSDFVPLTLLRELLSRHRFSFIGRRGWAWQYAASFRCHEPRPESEH
jgi:ubiquinone/menaquinone biosynthesis C-methylase UbiE